MSAVQCSPTGNAGNMGFMITLPDGSVISEYGFTCYHYRRHRALYRLIAAGYNVSDHTEALLKALM